MSDLLGLRPYQEAAVEAVEAAWASGVQRPALVMATGTGKTRTAAHVIDRRDVPTLFLVHRDELAVQSAQAFHDQGLDVGIVKAGQNDIGAKVIVGSVQTLQNPARLAQIGPRPLVVIDEAHHAAAASYRAVLTGLGAMEPGGLSVALGLSATLSRADGSGLGRIWDSVAYRYDILDGIADGFLCDVLGRVITVDGMRLSEVKMVGGDYGVASLSEMLVSSDARNAVIKAHQEHAADMPTIVFTPDVASAHLFAASFTEAGYATATVWGEMPIEDRRQIMTDYREGKIQILVNCMVLTEGTDLPRAQCAVIARPTTNPALYTQMVGRVLRPFPGKGDALVLDLAGISSDHRLATIVDLSTRRIQEVKPGETLREAAQREIKSKNPNLAGYVISSEEIDLFRQSSSVWLQTYAGYWFVPVGNAAVVLWPGKNDLYHVNLMSTRTGQGKRLRTSVHLEAAMSWGEQYAARYMDEWQQANGKSFGDRRRASWRRRKASASQIATAKSLGLEVPEGARAGDLSCIIDREIVSRKLDGKGKR